MMKNIRECLPIGTIVTLVNGNKKLMIFGIVQTMKDEGKPDQQFDYIGVPYPEGNLGEDYQYMFNHEDIVDVHFRGFEDAERQTFINNLAQILEHISQAGGEKK